MNILGLNYSFHDTSACLLSEDALHSAFEEERLSREKHTSKFPHLAIAKCLDYSGLVLADIDHIAISINPNLSLTEKWEYAAGLPIGSRDFIATEIDPQNVKNLSFWKWYNREWPADRAKRPRVHFVDHHHAHAVGSFLLSPWDEAALLAIDGGGEWRSIWTGVGKDHHFYQFSETTFPHSLGTFYTAATEFCGFKPMYDEGKTMGLAPTGDPSRFFDVVDRIVSVDESGIVRLDTSWFQFPIFATGQFCSPRMEEAFGPRRAGSTIAESHRDVAAAFQAVLEKNILKITAMLAKKTRSDRLVYSGGVALNSVANGKILKNGHFAEMYIMPGAGDGGTSIGAAAYVYNIVLKQPHKIVHNDPYIGDAFNNEDIEKFLKEAKLPYRYTDDIYSDAAHALHQGEIVGWFQGRMEFGPRALGGRSILADPTRLGMKDKINAEVKHREDFRPFAPSVLEEHASRYFTSSGPVPFMSMTVPVLETGKAAVPAVVHTDGTARLQTVSRLSNPKYYRLIEAFAELSGHPILLNTSFNVMDEPIVHSPRDAVRCFYSTGLDRLYIGDFVLEK